MGDHGRPTKYKPEFDSQAEKLCRMSGATDVQLAEFFDVSQQTVNAWKHEHKSILESIRRGKDDNDSELIQESLIKRDRGF